MADPATLSDLIDVTITLADAEVQRDGFSGIMLVSEHSILAPARVQVYKGKKNDILDAMVADGFVPGSPAYVQARAVLSQRPALAEIKIGRRDALDGTWADALDAIRTANSDWYGLAVDTRDAAEIVEIAEWCGSSAEGQFVLYMAQTKDADVKTASFGNIAETLASDDELERVAMVWHDPEVASAAAFAVIVSGNVAPFALANGQVLNIKVDGGSTQPFTFAATAGQRTGNVAEPYAITNNWHLDVQVDGGVTQVVTFQTADFADIANALLSEVVTLINADTTGLVASPSGGFLLLTSDTRGTGSSIQIMNTSTAGLLTALGLTASTGLGTGDAVNIAATTVAEVVTKLAGLTGAAASAGSGANLGRVVITGSTVKGEWGTLQVTGAAANDALKFSKALVKGQGTLEDYLDAALLGARLNADLDGIPPSGGQITWDNVVVREVYADTLTKTESLAIRGQNVLTFELRTKQRTPGEIHDGKMICNDWIDARTTADWLRLRLTEDFKFGIDAVTDAGQKIPYTDAGARTFIERTVKSRLILSAQSGHTIQDLEPPDPAAVPPKTTGIVIPTLAQQSDANKAARRWGTVEIYVQLQGALHGVIVHITLFQ